MNSSSWRQRHTFSLSIWETNDLSMGYFQNTPCCYFVIDPLSNKLFFLLLGRIMEHNTNNALLVRHSFENVIWKMQKNFSVLFCFGFVVWVFFCDLRWLKSFLGEMKLCFVVTQHLALIFFFSDEFCFAWISSYPVITYVLITWSESFSWDIKCFSYLPLFYYCFWNKTFCF